MEDFDRLDYLLKVSGEVSNLESKYKLVGFANANANISVLFNVINYENASALDKTIINGVRSKLNTTSAFI
jgi:hypothetical protein